MMTTKDELELVRSRHGGMLRPRDVVKFARNPKTALHNRFEWDDTAAAEAHRLEQAKKIIRVTVTMILHNDQPMRAYVSLLRDRVGKNGGYRAVAEVLTDDDLRAAMLEEALAELEVFRQKYEVLEALAPLFASIEKVKKPAKRRKSA